VCLCVCVCVCVCVCGVCGVCVCLCVCNSGLFETKTKIRCKYMNIMKQYNCFNFSINNTGCSIFQSEYYNTQGYIVNEGTQSTN